MESNSSTPLWLDLKITYIDENLDKVFSYLHSNSTAEKDGFYGITMNLLEKRIGVLIQEFQARPLVQDETFSKDKELVKSTARLLGMYLLAAGKESKDYRTAFLLFVNLLALLAPKSVDSAFIANALRFVCGPMPPKCVLEWRDIDEFYPDIVAHKLNNAMAAKAGTAQNEIFEMMGALQLTSRGLRIAAAYRAGLAQASTASLSIFDDLIQVVTPKSGKLKQSKASDIENIEDFTAQFIAAQHTVSTSLKKYSPGAELTVRLVSKKNGHLQVVSTSKEYQQVQGEVKFTQNFFFYNEHDFISAINVDDEFDAVYQGEGCFEIKTSFMSYIKNVVYQEGEHLAAEAVMVNDRLIGWGTEHGFGVYTPRIEGISQGDCAVITVRQMCVDSTGAPTGWINGDFVQATGQNIDYSKAKLVRIADSVYEKSEDDVPVTASILTPCFIKALYRLLMFGQQFCVPNPTDRYKTISTGKILATLIGQEQDVEYMDFVAGYLENLVRFAKGEYGKIEIPLFAKELESADSIMRRRQILSVLRAYGSAADAALLDEIIDNGQDTLLVKLATLVQSCNRLQGVINRSMQNVIKREIITCLAIETEGETDLDEENGIYLGIENDRQEFKTSFFHTPKNSRERLQSTNIFKGVCAFLNTTEGGTLYIGVNDLGYVQGIDSEIRYLQTITYGNYQGLDGYMRYITDEAKKIFDIDVVANIRLRPMYENQVVALEISPYEFGVVKVDNVAYLRVNGESVAIAESSESRIMSRKKTGLLKKDSKKELLSRAIRTQCCVILRGYQSSNSGSIRDRQVEVFDFTDNGTSIWCYDIDKNAVRLFNIARIGDVEITSRPWTHQAQHKCGEIDIFNMTGSSTYNITLRLNLRAKNLLLEEFPGSANYIERESDSSWLLTAYVYNIAGVARFYLGLANSIEIVKAPELVEYVREYCKAHLNV